MRTRLFRTGPVGVCHAQFSDPHILQVVHLSRMSFPTRHACRLCGVLDTLARGTHAIVRRGAAAANQSVEWRTVTF